jgi:hypothetical protein
MTTWAGMTTETANKWLGWAKHDARPGSRGHRAGTVRNKQRRGRGKGGEAGTIRGSCFLVAGAAQLKLVQDLTCSAVLAGVALLLSHRDHEPSCGVSHRFLAD